MKNIEKDNEKFNPKLYSGINSIIKFLDENNIKFNIHNNNFSIKSSDDFNIISSEINNIIDKLNFSETKITEISIFNKENIIIDLGKENYIKIISNGNILEYLKSKINNILISKK